MGTPTGTNNLKALLRNEGLGLCLSVKAFRSIEIAAIARGAGYDSLYVDLEHSSLGLETTSQICIAALGMGVTPLVRVPSADPTIIGRVLDGGSQGIIVPHVETSEQAAEIVAASRFPPRGRRSVGGPTVHSGYLPFSGSKALTDLDDAILVTAMIETRTGLDNAEAIAAVPGIDMLLIGTTDLTAELGIPGAFNHELVLQAYERTVAGARRHGKSVGIGGIKSDPALIGQLVEIGARFVSAGNDVGLLMSAGRSQIQALRSIRP